jgi:hypothetical protein
MALGRRPRSRTTLRLADSNFLLYAILESLAAVSALGIDSSILSRQADTGQGNWDINMPLQLMIIIKTSLSPYDDTLCPFCDYRL